jgi:hypothetical protein
MPGRKAFVGRAAYITVQTIAAEMITAAANVSQPRRGSPSKSHHSARERGSESGGGAGPCWLLTRNAFDLYLRAQVRYAPLTFGKLPVKSGGFVANFGQVVKATYVIERLRRKLRFDRNDLQLLRKEFPE